MMLQSSTTNTTSSISRSKWLIKSLSIVPSWFDFFTLILFWRFMICCPAGKCFWKESSIGSRKPSYKGLSLNYARKRGGMEFPVSIRARSEQIWKSEVSIFRTRRNPENLQIQNHRRFDFFKPRMESNHPPGNLWINHRLKMHNMRCECAGKLRRYKLIRNIGSVTRNRNTCCLLLIHSLFCTLLLSVISFTTNVNIQVSWKS